MYETEARVFAALADTTRRRLLTTLAESSPRTVTQLAREYPITRQGLQKHLDMLQKAGLVHTQAKGREKRYYFTPEPLDTVSEWIATTGKKWDRRLERLRTLVEGDEEL